MNAANKDGLMNMTDEVMAFSPSRRLNAELIADVARLDYLHGRVLDLTYGLGNFWTEHVPLMLTTNDANPATDAQYNYDFRKTPWGDESWDTVVLDPPYRLNGTPDQSFDSAYGIETPTRWQDRVEMILDGTREACRLSAGYVLVKCQAQVVSGKVVWQDRLVADAAEAVGFRLRDRFDLVSPVRPQPSGRSQLHARRNHSTLLIFVRES